MRLERVAPLRTQLPRRACLHNAQTLCLLTALRPVRVVSAAPTDRWSVSSGFGGYLALYASFGCLVVCAAAARQLLACYGGIRAAENLHSEALAAVLACPLSWFEANPSGRVATRFSKDVETVDYSLPDCANNLADCLLALAGALLVVSATTPTWLLALAPTAKAYLWLSSRRETFVAFQATLLCCASSMWEVPLMPRVVSLPFALVSPQVRCERSGAEAPRLPLPRAVLHAPLGDARRGRRAALPRAAPRAARAAGARGEGGEQPEGEARLGRAQPLAGRAARGARGRRGAVRYQHGGRVGVGQRHHRRRRVRCLRFLFVHAPLTFRGNTHSGRHQYTSPGRRAPRPLRVSGAGSTVAGGSRGWTPGRWACPSPTPSPSARR